MLSPGPEDASQGLPYPMGSSEGMYRHPLTPVPCCICLHKTDCGMLQSSLCELNMWT